MNVRRLFGYLVRKCNSPKAHKFHSSQLVCESLENRVVLNADVVTGTAGSDILIPVSLTNPVEMSGLGGDDTLIGSLRDDIINGGNGNDLIFGWNGDDTINGGKGIDTIVGGLGDDVIRASGGKNLIRNGRFERVSERGLVVDHGNANWATYTSIPGWTAEVGLIEIQEGPHGGTPRDNTTNFLELDSHPDGGNRDSNSTVSQTVAVENEGIHVLKFDFSGRDRRGTPAEETSSFKVTVTNSEGEAVFEEEFLKVERQWKTVEFPIDLEPGEYKLSFAAHVDDQEDTYGALIDNVALISPGNEIYGGLGDDTIVTKNGADLLFGGLGDDSLSSGAGNDSLNGGRGRDILRGGKGDDVLNGGRGSDWIRSDMGRDVAIGGRGADYFIFGKNFLNDNGLDGEEVTIAVDGEEISTSGNNVTVIADFGTGADSIVLQNSLLNNASSVEVVDSETVDGATEIVITNTQGQVNRIIVLNSTIDQVEAGIILGGNSSARAFQNGRGIFS